METMYERVKRMSQEEMKKFIYLVYLCGNRDGRDMYCDSPNGSYFGDYMLTLDASEVMPSHSVDDLYDTWLED